VEIGPVVASSERAGLRLLDEAFGRCAGRAVFVDVPGDNAPAVRWAEARGLRVQRPLTRMCRGTPVADRRAWIWASFGPEKG
jgi:hypothetical protein